MLNSPHIYILIVFMLAAGCATVGPDYKKPTVNIPDAWSKITSDHLKEGSPVFKDWWQEFNDPVLPELIKQARQANPTLKSAFQRIEIAKFQRGVATSQLYPTIFFDGASSRIHSSENLIQPVPQNNPFNNHSYGFASGWEIDFFGAVRRSIESADANIETSNEAYRDILVSLLSEVALVYIDIRTFEERLRLAQINLETMRESLNLTRSRFKNGLISELDVRQAESNLAGSQALIPLLTSLRQNNINALAVLLGTYPVKLEDLLLEPLPIPKPKRDFAIGIPADLLRNRPDIRQAERAIAAQSAQIGIATAELYPRFVLFGDFSLQAESTGDLIESSSKAWGFGPSFRWNIFNAGQVRSLINIEKAITEIAILNYENTVLKAVSEVESSFINISALWDRIEYKEQQVRANARSVVLVNVQYKQGLVEFQNVLDTERTQILADDDLAANKGALASNYINLYRALGGGGVLTTTSSSEAPIE